MAAVALNDEIVIGFIFVFSRLFAEILHDKQKEYILREDALALISLVAFNFKKVFFHMKYSTFSLFFLVSLERS